MEKIFRVGWNYVKMLVGFFKIKKNGVYFFSKDLELIFAGFLWINSVKIFGRSPRVTTGKRGWRISGKMSVRSPWIVFGNYFKAIPEQNTLKCSKISKSIFWSNFPRYFFKNRWKNIWDNRCRNLEEFLERLLPEKPLGWFPKLFLEKSEIKFLEKQFNSRVTVSESFSGTCRILPQNSETISVECLETISVNNKDFRDFYQK